MYECSIHCYTQAECAHVLSPSKHPVRPQAEKITMVLADMTRIGVVGAGTMGAGIAEIRHGVRTQEAADMAWMRFRPTHTR